LARDQMRDLEGLLAAVGRDDLTVAVYDGDTPPPVRQALREVLPEFRSPQLVVQEPLFTPLVPMSERANGMRMASSS
jgi:hypothetical protein